MERERYPANWEEISRQVKDGVGWRCQECGRQCRKPGESLIQLVNRLVEKHDLGPLYYEIVEVPQRFTLSVAHLDQDPSNNDPSNLRALCSVCHLEHDRPFRVHNMMRKRERSGQLHLLL